jgi:hypothetical protein
MVWPMRSRAHLVDVVEHSGGAFQHFDADVAEPFETRSDQPFDVENVPGEQWASATLRDTMLLLFLSVVLSQAQAKPATGPEKLPPEVMATLVKAAERVTAIGQAALVCQSELTADRSHVDSLRKQYLELVEKVAGIDRDIAAARDRQRPPTKYGSPEYTSAARDLNHANTVRVAAARRSTEIANEERQLTAKIKASEACVAKAKTELDALRR